MSEEINFDEVEFGEPIEEREGNFFDGYRYGLRKAFNIIDNQCKEIERLKEENKKYNKWIESLNKDNHRLHSIIKEVREYLDIDESIRKTCKRYDVNGIAILEILDKENI